jgi:hypothetical protein
MKSWEIEEQPEFDFSDCYLANYPPLDLSKYKNDRNYSFYKLQNDLLLNYNKTHTIDKNILWQMFGTIENVVSSLAKKNICKGCNVPDFDNKVFEAATRVLGYYEKFPYFRAKGIENVAYWKVKEVFLDGNLQLNERAVDFNTIFEGEQEKRKRGEADKNFTAKTEKEIEEENMEKKELKEIREFNLWRQKQNMGDKRL